MTDLISGREAATLMKTAGLSRRRADQVLAAGLAGTGLRTRTAVLYERQSVLDLTCRPEADSAEVASSCPRGVIVSRLAPGADSQVIRHTMPWLSRLEFDLMARHLGFLPWVATVCGFVVRGGDLVGARVAAGQQTQFELREPGEWFGVLEGRRFPTGPGRPWVWWGRHCQSGEDGRAMAAATRLRE